MTEAAAAAATQESTKRGPMEFISDSLDMISKTLGVVSFGKSIFGKKAAKAAAKSASKQASKSATAAVKAAAAAALKKP